MLLLLSRIRTPLQKAIVATLFIVVVAGFGTLVYVSEIYFRRLPRVTDRDKQEDDIREATFRYQFVHDEGGRPRQRWKAAVYFLSLWGTGGDGKDPSDDFIKRFAGNVPPVKKYSQSSIDDEQNIIDDQTRARGVIFRVTKIVWFGQSKVEVSGGHYVGYLNSSGEVFYLEKKNGKWVVVKHELRWIS
jgi:hypothetical protein